MLCLSICLQKIIIMKIKSLTSFLYKCISRIFAKIIFTRDSEIYIRNYLLPINLIKKYYFLYPCYKKAFEEILPKTKINDLGNKVIIFYQKNGKEKDFIINKKRNIYIIGNDISKVNLQLYKTSLNLSKKLNINKIFLRKHPRSNFKKDSYLIKTDHRDLENIGLNSLILISFSSLLPYFLNKNFTVYVCKKSLLLELKTKKKFDSYLRIYKNTYPEKKLIFI